MNRKATIFRCPNCGELSIYPRNEGTEFLCECGGKLIPEAQATVGVDFASGAPPTRREVLYLCDRRACERCPNDPNRCRHTGDIQHAKNFHSLDGSYVENEVVTISTADRTTSVRIKVDASELDSALDKVRALRDAMDGESKGAVEMQEGRCMT